MDQSNTKFITINEVHFQDTKLKFKNPLKYQLPKTIQASICLQEKMMRLIYVYLLTP